MTEFLDRTKHVLTSGIGELVIGIECIAVDGWIMPLMILFAGIVHLENWYRDQTIYQMTMSLRRRQRAGIMR